MTMFLTILGVLMPIIQWGFRLFGVSKANQQAFYDKIQNTKNDGLISIEGRDEFRRQDEELDKPEVLEGKPKP